MLGDAIASPLNQFLCKFPAAEFGFRSNLIEDGAIMNTLKYPHDQPSLFRLLAALTASFALTIVANAQDADTDAGEEELFAMEEIIVTGTASAGRTKFESSVGISTFNSDEIAKQAPASTADLISAVPGFWVESTAGTTQGNVFARGIIQDGGYRYVGLMEDGIPIYPMFELSFYNPDQFVRVDATIERVEAVRGGTSPIFTTGAVGVTNRP